MLPAGILGPVARLVDRTPDRSGQGRARRRAASVSRISWQAPLRTPDFTTVQGGGARGRDHQTRDAAHVVSKTRLRHDAPFLCDPSAGARCRHPGHPGAYGAARTASIIEKHRRLPRRHRPPCRIAAQATTSAFMSDARKPSGHDTQIPIATADPKNPNQAISCSSASPTPGDAPHSSNVAPGVRETCIAANLPTYASPKVRRRRDTLVGGEPGAGLILVADALLECGDARAARIRSMPGAPMLLSMVRARGKRGGSRWADLSGPTVAPGSEEEQDRGGDEDRRRGGGDDDEDERDRQARDRRSAQTTGGSTAAAV